MDDYRRRKELLLNTLGGKCVYCGGHKDLQFDHIDPSTKSFTILSRYYYKLDTILEELKKCQLLCKPCHKLKTIQEDSHRVIGCRNGRSKLTEKDVKEIRVKYKQDTRIASLAREYKVSRATLQSVVYNKTWIHVK